MQIGEIATRQVATCGPDDSLARAARIMWEHDCGCVPVVENAQVIGMITDRDVCMAALWQGTGLGDAPVRRSMSTPVLVCRESESVVDVAARMAHHQVRRLVVLDACGTLAGIVSLNDIARHTAYGARFGKAGLGAEALARTLAAIGTRPEDAAATPVAA